MFQKKTRLYAIVDQETCLQNHILVYDFTKILVNCGVEIIQYRNKLDSREAVEIYFGGILQLLPPDTICIINDYPQIAQTYKTVLHLGQTDTNINLYQPFGRSTHSLPEVKHALSESPSPDYIGFGAMFASQTKPEISPQFQKIDEVLKLWKKDIVLIGGINDKNIDLLPKKDNIYYAIIQDFFSEDREFSLIEKRVRNLVEKCGH